MRKQAVNIKYSSLDMALRMGEVKFVGVALHRVDMSERSARARREQDNTHAMMSCLRRDMLRYGNPNFSLKIKQTRCLGDILGRFHPSKRTKPFAKPAI